LANPGKSTPEELKAKLRIMAASPPEPVTEGLAVPPPIGERAKLFDDLVKKYGGPDNLDREKAKALAAALKEAGFMVFGILPTEAETGEAKPAAPAKKAKRQRRQKK
jgi:hypothetical protein